MHIPEKSPAIRLTAVGDFSKEYALPNRCTRFTLLLDYNEEGIEVGSVYRLIKLNQNQVSFA